MMDEERWLKVESMSEGQFSTERAVSLRHHDGRACSLFVDERDVRGNSIRVRLLDSRNGWNLISLPQYLSDGNAVMTVRDHLLST